MGSPGAVRDFLSVRLGNLEHEVFAVLLPGTRNRLI
jgi:DNA repair protein RadC